MTDSGNYSFANYNSLVENTEASGNAVTGALVRTIRVAHQLANSMAAQEKQIKNAGEVLANVLSRMGALERWRTEQGHNIAALEHILPKVQYKEGSDQEQQEGFTENTIARLGSLEMWRGKHATSYGQLTRSVIDGESRLEKLEGKNDPSSTFGDNVLAALQELKDGGQICELFAEDMREQARDVLEDCDISDQVEHALGNIDISDYVSVDNFDAYEMWEHISGYVEDHVAENHTLTCAANTAEYNEEKIDMITSRLKQIGIALDPKDRSLYGDNRTPQEAFHDGMRGYADYLDEDNRHLLAQFAKDLLTEQNKKDAVIDALNKEGGSDDKAE